MVLHTLHVGEDSVLILIFLKSSLWLPGAFWGHHQNEFYLSRQDIDCVIAAGGSDTGGASLWWDQMAFV